LAGFAVVAVGLLDHGVETDVVVRGRGARIPGEVAVDFAVQAVVVDLGEGPAARALRSDHVARRIEPALADQGMAHVAGPRLDRPKVAAVDPVLKVVAFRDHATFLDSSRT